MKRWLGQLLPAVTIALLSVVYFFVMRLILAVIYSAKISQVDGWANVFISGLRVDISTISYLFIVPAVLSLLLTRKGKISRYGKIALSVTLSVLFCLFVFSSWQPSVLLTNMACAPIVYLSNI